MMCACWKAWQCVGSHDIHTTWVRSWMCPQGTLCGKSPQRAAVQATGRETLLPGEGRTRDRDEGAVHGTIETESRRVRAKRMAAWRQRVPKPRTFRGVRVASCVEMPLQNPEQPFYKPSADEGIQPYGPHLPKKTQSNLEGRHSDSRQAPKPNSKSRKPRPLSPL